MLIDFQIIPHKKQRYSTMGDYWQDKTNRHWQFCVSRMKDKRYVMLVFLHEVIEWTICRLTGVSMKAIDKFDKAYEKARNCTAPFSEYDCTPCGCPFCDEPGDDLHAPYHRAHKVAAECEELIAHALDVDWYDYNNTVESLNHQKPTTDLQPITNSR